MRDTLLSANVMTLLTLFSQLTMLVGAWALLGCLWEIMEASTEGLGEAASIRVAHLLAIGRPDMAKKVSYKVLYLAGIAAVSITSLLYMTGKYLVILLSTESTLQHLMYDTIPIIGLANLTMSFAQACWSLIGAQGRFRVATGIVLVSRWLITMPIALISVLGFFLDLNSVSGSLVVGFSTASCVLSYVVLRSNWEELSKIMQEMNLSIDGNCLGSIEGYDEDDFSDADDDKDESNVEPRQMNTAAPADSLRRRSLNP